MKRYRLWRETGEEIWLRLTEGEAVEYRRLGWRVEPA